MTAVAETAVAAAATARAGRSEKHVLINVDESGHSELWVAPVAS